MSDRFQPKGIVGRLTWFCLQNKLVVFLLLLGVVGQGLLTAPFDWDLGLPRNSVPVDAIPDIGENQQIVFTEWHGRSPQDIQDQVTYPLTTALLGIPHVKTVRSYAYFGFSSIYVIFDESVDFYWSRSRILEKLNSLPPGTLPEGVSPMLGPDATALGQIFWYTLEGRDPSGNPTGGWDPHELRSTQDFYVRYGLLGVKGVAEVASVGGFVQEYQVDVDPSAMRVHKVTLSEVFRAIQNANRDVGARNMEINNVEYFIRGLGLVKSIEDLEFAVVKTNDNVPIYVKDVALVTLGPAQRRGILDKGGAEVVGGVVTARYGANPLDVIKGVKQRVGEISPGLPEKILTDGTRSKLTIVPFYDRTGLIYETLDTLKEALSQEVLVTVIVILFMLVNLRSSVLVSGLLPLAVLMTFIGMKYTGVDANIVALSGIAIAIGTMVDMGIVMVENIVQHLDKAPPDASSRQTIYEAATEVGGAVVTAVATTVIGFLPVFTMEAAEGKLFRPLAFTKTYALIAAIAVSLVLIPPLADLLLGRRGKLHKYLRLALEVVGVGLAFALVWWLGLIILLQVIWLRLQSKLPILVVRWTQRGVTIAVALLVAWFLSNTWLPLGVERGVITNYLFCLFMIGGILLFFQLFQWTYPVVMRWALANRLLFLSMPAALVVLGLTIWLGFDTVFNKLPQDWKTNPKISKIAHALPGLGKEFMPPLDEGSFLYMPTTSVHAAINEAADVLRKQDMGFAQIPEVASAVGKLGRAETPLDPAPISMIETIINYHPEFLRDEHGKRLTFRYDPDAVDVYRDPSGKPVLAPDGLPYQVRGAFLRGDHDALEPVQGGQPFRLWRPALDPNLNEGRAAWPGIQSPDDIWDEIVRKGKLPGTTSAPKLQPIAARLVMLQSGMRAPMGIKVKGPDLETIEAFGLKLEQLIKDVPGVSSAAVIADRIIGKPYLEFHIDRKAIARYGIQLEDVQSVIEVAIGGKTITTTVEGRERYPVRVRYQRELRDTPDTLKRVLVATPTGIQIPLTQISDLRYVKGPQVIKSEDTFLLSYVLFDKEKGHAEVDVVERVRDTLKAMEADGSLSLPAGVSYSFAGNYENQVRATKKLILVVPLALGLIFLILYLQFRSVSTALMIFGGIAVAASGGFLLIWLYGQSWFLNIDLFGANLRDLFGIGPVNLSVAVWVGFLALFGIATDDGVLIGTYLKQRFAQDPPTTIQAIRDATLEAGMRRVRPALMTSATTVIALIPVLTSTGRGADIMKPMAIPTFGGMMVVTLSIFIVPVLYSGLKELSLHLSTATPPETEQGEQA